MTRSGAATAAFWVALGLTAALAAAPADAKPKPRPRPAARSCCHVPAGTFVEVELVDPISTKTQKRGDTFALRLAAPVIVRGQIVLPAGAPGVGEVVDSAKPGMGGKPAKLVLAARYLTVRRGRVPLQSLQLAGGGHNNATAAQAVGLTGIAFAPLGFVGFAVQGGNVDFPAGTTAIAKLAADVNLPSMGRASRSATLAAASAAVDAEPVAQGSIGITPPPPGEGQVVFFRRKSLMGTGQWFNVREDGKALGKLSNGAYFVQTADPGQHTYTATEEPEFKDRLRLEIDAGETYFVEGQLTKGLVLGAASLSPSNPTSFVKASKDLKLASAPSIETPDQQGTVAQPANVQQANVQGADEQATGAAEAQSQAQGDSTGDDRRSAGYRWAQQNGVAGAAGCPPPPSTYRAGCLAYVNDETAPPR
ncbi:MAG: DUF2846 domain-containing protein [Caulobacteraceae bacterium]|nr:DUF2846 domain-containing protein [Caulobacteraceae bacterium]